MGSFERPYAKIVLLGLIHVNRGNYENAVGVQSRMNLLDTSR